MSDARSEAVTANVALSVGDTQMQFSVSVPKDAISRREIVPLARVLAKAVVDYAVRESEAAGKSISCKKGCGACCRQLVPISSTEARMIADLVESMPEPRRSAVRQRFAEARAKLEASGMWQKLEDRQNWATDGFQDIGIAYFHQGVPCPFLEDESCSIHPDRPITCREYLVTSPAANCAQPRRDTIDLVRIPLKVWTAVAKLDPIPPGSPYVPWVPLVMALDWAVENPQEPPSQPGPQLLEALLHSLTNKNAASAHEASDPAPSSE